MPYAVYLCRGFNRVSLNGEYEFLTLPNLIIMILTLLAFTSLNLAMFVRYPFSPHFLVDGSTAESGLLN